MERCADAPVALTSAACFSYGGKAYTFGGRKTNGTYTNHIYCYDPQTDQWTDIGATPLKPRVRPRAVTVEETVFVGLGGKGQVLIDSTYLTDWWRWIPATNTWDSLARYPIDRTIGPVMATDGEVIYSVYGGKHNFERWVMRYNIARDEWEQMADGLPRMAEYPPRAHSAVGGYCQGRWFFGAGYTRDMSSAFWVEAEMAGDSVIWHKRTPLSGRRHNAASVSDGQYIYVVGGEYLGGTVTTGKYYDDILRYDPQRDAWTRIGHLPDGERENMCCWIIDNTLYIGLGNDKRNHPCAQLYRIRL